MRFRLFLSAALVLVSASALAQSTHPTDVGLNLGLLPTGTAEVVVTRHLVPRLQLRFNAGLYRRFVVEQTLHDCYGPSCPTVYPAPPFRADRSESAAVGFEWYEQPDRAGFYFVGLAGAGRVSSDAGGSRAAAHWALGAGLRLPLGSAAVVLEGRYMRFTGIPAGKGWLLPLTVGLRL